MKTITSYSINEIKRLSPSDVKGLAIDNARQNYSLYLKVCRKFEHEIEWLNLEAQTQVPFRKPSNLSDKSFQKAIETHEKQLEQWKSSRLDLFKERVNEIANMERIMEKRNEEYKKYPVRGIEIVLNHMESEKSPQSSELEEIPPEQVLDSSQSEEDIISHAKSVVDQLEKNMEFLSKKEKTAINKIKTPLKTAIKKSNKSTVERKLKELDKVLKD